MRKIDKFKYDFVRIYCIILSVLSLIIYFTNKDIYLILIGGLFILTASLYDTKYDLEKIKEKLEIEKYEKIKNI